MSRKKRPGTDEDWLLSAAEELTSSDTIQTLVDKSPFKYSHDKHGHDVYLAARLPTDFGRWVSKMVESPGSPYEIRSDVVRDALYLGLCIISLRMDLSKEWRALAVLSDITAKLAERRAFITRTIDLVKEFMEAWDRGEHDLVREGLTRYLDSIAELDEQVKHLVYATLKKQLRAYGMDVLVQDVK